MSQEQKKMMKQLMQLQMLLHRCQMQRMRDCGPYATTHRGQGRVLAILKLKPEISQKELGFMLNIRNQSLGELLTKLEKSGLITREPSQEDKRVMNIKLTEKGMEAAQTVDTKEMDFDNLFDVLSEDEKTQFSQSLEKLIEALKAQMAQSENMSPEDFEKMRRGRAGFRHGRGGFGPMGGTHPFRDHMGAMSGYEVFDFDIEYDEPETNHDNGTDE